MGAAGTWAKSERPNAQSEIWLIAPEVHQLFASGPTMPVETIQPTIRTAEPMLPAIIAPRSNRFRNR